MQMAQPTSWVQTPAAHGPRQVPMARGNPVTYVRSPVQHMTVPVGPVVRPPVVQPPAPRWIYAAPLKQQRSVQSTPGANALPKVVAGNVGAPQAEKDNPLIEGRVPTNKGLRPSSLPNQCGTGTFSSFLVGSLFAPYLFFVLRCTCCAHCFHVGFLKGTWDFRGIAKEPTKHYGDRSPW